MAIKREKIEFKKTDKLLTNITPIIEEMAKDWGKTGLVNIFSKHTTCCLFLLEDEILHKTDVRFFLDKMAPKWKEPEGDHKNIKYLHDLISLRDDVPEDERINGHSHIRSLFFNSSESVPVDDGKLLLGPWKQIFLVELDPGRDRELICTFMGE